tara:strand:- start:11 stop:442 length:432 start_codon:yes stop_codon:yes gene_type:complete
MAAPVVLGIARYLLGRNIKPLAREFRKFLKSGKIITPKQIKKLEKKGITTTTEAAKKGPLLGKNIKIKDARKLSMAGTLRETLKGRSKKYDKSFSSGSPFVKKRKQAIKDLDKYIGNIESRYVTKQRKGGLIRGMPKLAKRGF